MAPCSLTLPGLQRTKAWHWVHSFWPGVDGTVGLVGGAACSLSIGCTRCRSAPCTGWVCCDTSAAAPNMHAARVPHHAHAVCNAGGLAAHGLRRAVHAAQGCLLLGEGRAGAAHAAAML